MAIHATRVLGVGAMLFTLTACPGGGGGGGTPTIVLKGDVSCPVPPPTVTGTATLDPGRTAVTATATILCNGIPVQGVVLSGEIRNAVRTLSFSFPPTDAAGNTTLTGPIPGTIAVSPGDQFQIRVLDDSDRAVSPPDPVGVSIQ